MNLFWLLFCVNIVVLYCYYRVNIFLKGAPLHSRVNVVHFKGAQLDRHETYIWNWHVNFVVWDGLLEYNQHVTHISLFLHHFWDAHTQWNIYKNTKWLFSVRHMVLIFVYRLCYCVHEITTWISACICRDMWSDNDLVASTLCMDLIWNRKKNTCWIHSLERVWKPYYMYSGIADNQLNFLNH